MKYKINLKDGEVSILDDKVIDAASIMQDLGISKFIRESTKDGWIIETDKELTDPQKLKILDFLRQ